MAVQQQQILQLFERSYHPKITPELDDPGFGTRSGLTPSAGGSPSPDLGMATTIRRGELFSPFSRSHRQAAKALCEVFQKTKNETEFYEVAMRCKDQVNEMLFIYALSFVILRKPELRKFRIPSVVETLPDKFATHDMIQRAQKEINANPDENEKPIVIDQEFSGTLLRQEHRLSYWREDYGINVHHWHWHLVFPVEMDFDRDRKGEIFFYMHQQMMARYDLERLSVGLNRVLPLKNLREPIEEGYFSKLNINNAGRPWGNRQDNTVLRDVRRDDFDLGFFKISDLELWYNRVLDGIHLGYFVDREGNRVRLSDDDLYNGKRGIDILGDVFEADPERSVNYPFYGDFHNFAHILITLAHDPDFSHKEEMGVMGDASTSMRDPAFYKLHRLVDDLFQEYKMQQRPYTREELNLECVKVEEITVQHDTVKNHLTTGWNRREFEAQKGLDFNSSRPVKLRLIHLDHKPFSYHIQIANNAENDVEVTVRIFLAPTLDERGNPMNFMDQRLLWVEMDKFVKKLTPGTNTVVRSSLESSITGPEEHTFRDLEHGIEIIPGTPETAVFGQCGCGWPQHMLLPRGKPEGMDFQLFVMLTDYEKDKVQQTVRNRTCSNAVSYCGILDSKFPDSRPMGFPFDRRNPNEVSGNGIKTVRHFADQFDNMLLQDIKITFVGDQFLTGEDAPATELQQ